MRQIQLQILPKPHQLLPNSVPSTVPSMVPTTAQTTVQTTTTPAASATTTVPSFNVTEEALDFARVAVLFVLQEKSVDDAVTAQSKLQNFFTTPQNAGNVSLGNGASLDFFDLSVNLGNGSIGGAANNMGGMKRRSLR